MVETTACGVCGEQGVSQDIVDFGSRYVLWVCPHGHGVISRDGPRDPGSRWS